MTKMTIAQMKDRVKFFKEVASDMQMAVCGFDFDARHQLFVDYVHPLCTLVNLASKSKVKAAEVAAYLEQAEALAILAVNEINEKASGMLSFTDVNKYVVEVQERKAEVMEYIRGLLAPVPADGWQRGDCLANGWQNRETPAADLPKFKYTAYAKGFQQSYHTTEAETAARNMARDVYALHSHAGQVVYRVEVQKGGYAWLYDVTVGADGQAIESTEDAAPPADVQEFKEGEAIQFSAAVGWNPFDQGPWINGTIEGQTKRCWIIRGEDGEVNEYWKHRVTLQKVPTKAEQVEVVVSGFYGERPGRVYVILGSNRKLMVDDIILYQDGTPRRIVQIDAQEENLEGPGWVSICYITDKPEGDAS